MLCDFGSLLYGGLAAMTADYETCLFTSCSKIDTIVAKFRNVENLAKNALRRIWCKAHYSRQVLLCLGVSIDLTIVSILALVAHRVFQICTFFA
jgi:hypothetical protein